MFEVQLDGLRLRGRNHRPDHLRDIPSSQIVRFQNFAGDARLFTEPRLHRHDLTAGDYLRIHSAKPHADQVPQTNSGPRGLALNP